jgi:hypothetical protein
LKIDRRDGRDPQNRENKFCWGEIVREINVSRAGDPVHAGDKALTQETPVQRGRVNRYANRSSVVSAAGYKPQGLGFESH